MPKQKKKPGTNLYEKKYQGKSYYGRTLAELTAKIDAVKRKEHLGYTFSEVAEQYQNYINGPTTPIRRGTLRSYLGHLRKLEAAFGSSYMNELDAQAVRAYLDLLKIQGFSLKTITNRRSVLSCVFSYWCAQMHGTCNPVELSGLPHGLTRTEREPPTEEQCDIVNANTMDAGFWAQLYRFTGIRLGEANALQWKDFNFKDGYITIDDSIQWDGNQPYNEEVKTAKGVRKVPILDGLAVLAHPLAAQHKKTDYVMSGTSKPLTQSQYNRRWTNYCRKIGLATSYQKLVKISATACRPARETTRTEWKADVTAHQFRHLYATALFEAGVPDLVAQTLLGHADIATTKKIYTHIRERSIKASTASLNLYFNNIVS